MDESPEPQGQEQEVGRAGSWGWVEGKGHCELEACADKGDVVTFTATLSRSDKDPKFGFFKRPSKASFVSRAVSA